MKIISQDSPIIKKTRELCEQITQEAEFTKLQEQVKTFMNDEHAKKQYRNHHEFGHKLHEKQHAGLEISEDEIAEYENSQKKILSNEVTNNFLEAQQHFSKLQKTIAQYLNMTLELGRVPNYDELTVENHSCCGGGCQCD